MRAGVVGAGMLGLVLARRLAQAGHDVTVVEASERPGGLACSHDYGAFTWDRFYHCILPQDSRLLDLVDDLGLGGELRWTRTGTGYFADGRFHPMNGNRDFLRFPLLSLPEKARLAFTTLWARHGANPERLYGVTADEWLTRLCGRRTFEVFWRPLLRAKFGPYADRVAAVFIWATLTRLMGARRGSSNAEQLGYVSGGYETILGALVRDIEGAGGRVLLGAPVSRIEKRFGEEDRDPGCTIRAQRVTTGEQLTLDVDQVFFTAPTRLARGVVDDALAPHLADMERAHPTSREYLGVACLVLALEGPLTPYYVLNIGDERVQMTGLIEMTNLVDARAETAGLSLVYLPQYMAADDPAFDAPDEALRERLIGRGLTRLFPGFDEGRIVYEGVHKARFVQPLPLARRGARREEPAGTPALVRPFQVLNTSMLRCATLNNDEVVGLVGSFLERNPELVHPRASARRGRLAAAAVRAASGSRTTG